MEKDKKREMLNKSYSYLIPLLNEFCTINPDGEFFLLLRNVYTKYKSYENIICLEYDNYDNEDFKNYIKTLQTNDLFKFLISTENIVVILDFPEKFMYEYKCYKRGKFSKFREESKLLILNYLLGVHSTNITSKVRSVLYKEPGLRKSLERKLMLDIPESYELSSIPDINKETLIL